MKRKLQNILLVDDDDDCNFFHERLLSQSSCVENIHIVKDGKAALDFLQFKNDNKSTRGASIRIQVSALYECSFNTYHIFCTKLS